MDGMTGTVDTTATLTSDEATEKETPSSGTEPVASEKGETAGGEQSTAEGSQGQERRERQRGPSKLDTIKELRAKLRERDSTYSSEIGTLKSQLAELRTLTQQRSAESKPRKTFWEAPEEVLEERMKANMEAMKEDILSNLHRRETESQQTTEWKQETSEAAKFIGSQKGVSTEDFGDIEELIRSTPAMMNMRPLDRAKYALYLWREQRGITDRTEVKNRATTVVGAPQSSGGKKVWTQSEIDAKIDSFPKDQRHWTPENKTQFEAFEREVKDAVREGRVK